MSQYGRGKYAHADEVVFCQPCKKAGQTAHAYCFISGLGWMCKEHFDKLRSPEAP